MKIYWFCILSVLFISCNGNTQDIYSELPKTNLNLFQGITSEGLNELEDVITIIGKDKIFKITVDDTTERKDFFVNELKQKFHNLKFVYVVSDSVDYEIRFSNLKFITGYTNLRTKKILGDEYIDRELTAMFSFSVSGKDLNFRKVNKVFKDEVKIDKIEYIESGNYAFIKSVLPEKTFLKKIIIPAVIVAVSAIATILFFTIRSK